MSHKCQLHRQLFRVEYFTLPGYQIKLVKGSSKFLDFNTCLCYYYASRTSIYIHIYRYICIVDNVSEESGRSIFYEFLPYFINNPPASPSLCQHPACGDLSSAPAQPEDTEEGKKRPAGKKS